MAGNGDLKFKAQKLAEVSLALFARVRFGSSPKLGSYGRQEARGCSNL